MKITQNFGYKKSVEVEINVNDHVKVQLTEFGHKIYSDSFVQVGMKPRRSKVDSDGWSEFQIWDLMRLYGQYLEWGASELPFKTTIKFEEKQ